MEKVGFENFKKIGFNTYVNWKTSGGWSPKLHYGTIAVSLEKVGFENFNKIGFDRLEYKLKCPSDILNLLVGVV